VKTTAQATGCMGTCGHIGGICTRRWVYGAVRPEQLGETPGKPTHTCRSLWSDCCSLQLGGRLTKMWPLGRLLGAAAPRVARASRSDNGGACAEARGPYCAFGSAVQTDRSSNRILYNAAMPAYGNSQRTIVLLDTALSADALRATLMWTVQHMVDGSSPQKRGGLVRQLPVAAERQRRPGRGR